VGFREFRHGFKDKQGNTWEIQAKEAKLMRAQNRADLEGVRILLTTSKDKRFTLTSRMGKAHFMKGFDQPTKVELKGDVKVAFPKGFSLKTETLTFIPASRLITSQDPIFIEGPGVWLKGKGLKATLKDSVMKLSGTPITRIKPSKLPGGHGL
jgi:LPS export ABC transporter protein LptC